MEIPYGSDGVAWKSESGDTVVYGCGPSRYRIDKRGIVVKYVADGHKAIELAKAFEADETCPDVKRATQMARKVTAQVEDRRHDFEI